MTSVYMNSTQCCLFVCYKLFAQLLHIMIRAIFHNSTFRLTPQSSHLK